MKIQIGKLSFSNKAEAIEHFQEMLHRYELGDLVDEIDTGALLALLERHPTYEQKRGAGILEFSIARAPYDTRGFHIVRVDGTSADFSYLKYLAAPETALSKVVKALRGEVQEDILHAKRIYFESNGNADGHVPCKLTGNLVTIDQSDADHASPYTFQVLATTFLNARKIAADEALLTPPADNQFGRTLLDRALVEDWRQFHHQHADLRIVAKPEHRALSQQNRPRAENRQLILQNTRGQQ